MTEIKPEIELSYLPDEQIKTTYDVSFQTTKDYFKLYQAAGEVVGLPVRQVSQILDGDGHAMAVSTGYIGMRYQTSDSELLARFNAKVAELQATPAQTDAPVIVV
jgi:hypothetical protein